MNALQRSLRKAKFGVAKHSPEILTVVGCVSIVSTAVLAAKATPGAIKKYKEAEEKKGGKLNAIETVKACGLSYLPAVGSAAIGMAAVISSNRISSKRAIEAASAALTAETMLHAYQEKVKEQIGEKKSQDILDEIAEEKVKNDPPKECTTYVIGNDKPLWYDSLSGRYFNASKNDIQAGINRLDAAMLSGDMYISVNDYYEEVCKLPSVNSDERGFNVNDGLLNDNIYFTSMLDENGTPIGIINFYTNPKTGYNWFGE